MTRKNFNELRKNMSSERQRRNATEAHAMLTEMALAELRHAAGLTQTELARVMGVSQANLSKLEHQDDMQVTTLRRIVEAIGGRLEFVVTMPTGVVKINQFSETVEPNR